MLIASFGTKDFVGEKGNKCPAGRLYIHARAVRVNSSPDNLSV